MRSIWREERKNLIVKACPEFSGIIAIENSKQSNTKGNQMKIYVGNLLNEVTEEDLRLAFEQFGKVESVTIMNDKQSGQSQDFGIVEMPSSDEGKSAIDGLNGKEFKGKAINVNLAGSRAERRGNSRGYKGGGGYGNGRGGFVGGKGGYSGGSGFSGRRSGQSRGR